MTKKVIKILLVFILSFSLIGGALPAVAAQTVVNEYPLSSGVQYKQYTYKDTYTNSINHLAIDLNDSYTKVGLGLPTTLTSRERTTSIATRNSVEGNRVVGAINASFFSMSEGYPLFLLAENNEILNGGLVSEGSGQYMNQPTAFGINADGSGEIDYFDFNVSMQYNGKSYELNGLNHDRLAGEAVVYTPQFRSKTTDTNEFGVEIVVDTGAAISSNYFGQTLTGVVSQVKPYGSKEALTIPENGFVISIQGSDWRNALETAKIGEKISVNFSIDSKWNNAQFILASGPMLVKDGKPYIMMSTSSSRATEVAPRTVVAISKDKKTIHYITVDGRQSHSKGMNMSQLANYLVELGVDRAINLDGGGSTSMGIRQYGSNNVVLINKPSDSSERRVSAILQAISTAPTGKPTQIKFSRTRTGTFLAGASSTLAVQYLLDQYYNPVAFNDSQITLTSQNKTLSINNLTYKTTKAGDDRIYISYNGVVVQSFPVKTVDAPTTMSISGTATTIEAGNTATFSITAKDANGKDLLYDASQVKWSVNGNIGTISSAGVFTAGQLGGSGEIVATLGTKSVSQTVTVPKPSLFEDVTTNHQYIKEIEYLAVNNIVTGYTIDGTFRPSNNLTRAHAAVMISRALELNTSTVINPGFTDVPITHPYYKEIAAIAQLDIVSGKENNLYDPNATLTRGQMAKILTEAYNLSGKSSKEFKDVPTDNWTYEYIQALASNNITTGYEDNTFRPFIPISRAHFSLFLYRTLHR